MQCGESLHARARCCIAVLWGWSTSPTCPGAKTLSHGQCGVSVDRVAVPAVEITPYGSGPGACALTWIVQQSVHRAAAINALRGECCTCWGELMRHVLGSVGTPWSSEKLWLRPCSGLEDGVQAS
jgi:hypothetical protein